MTITRLQVEAVVTKRLGLLLEEAQMTSSAGANPHLIDPFAWALRALGYTPASLTDLADSDLEGVSAAHVDALLDLAELRALESVAGNLTAVDVTIGPVSERKGMLADRVTRLVADKRKTIVARWGNVLETPLEDTGGPVRLLSL
jgi:hypothetical protein